MQVLVLSLPSNVACGKNTALSHNEGILVGDLLGDAGGVIFQCGVGGEGGGEPDAPVSFCIAVASVCDSGTSCGVDVDFTVCAVVDLPVLDVLAVSVGTDINGLCLGACISCSFFALAGRASISCNVQLVTSVYGLPVWSNIGIVQSGLL